MDDDDYDDDSDVKMWLVLGGRQVPQLTSISAGTISISHITNITIIIIITQVDLTGGKSTRASQFLQTVHGSEESQRRNHRHVYKWIA